MTREVLKVLGDTPKTVLVNTQLYNSDALAEMLCAGKSVVLQDASDKSVLGIFIPARQIDKGALAALAFDAAP